MKKGIIETVKNGSSSSSTSVLLGSVVVTDDDNREVTSSILTQFAYVPLLPSSMISQ